MARLEGKTALVVGAGGGMGRASAELLSKEGANVVVADLDGAAASATAASITQAGGRATSLGVDVTASTAAETLVKAALDAFGALDVFVYSAGTTATAGILDHSRADWDRVLSVNLTAPFVIGQAVARGMVEGKKGGPSSSSPPSSPTRRCATRQPISLPREACGRSPWAWHLTSPRTASASTQSRRGRC